MNSKKVKRRERFSISIYRQGGDKASVVFRKKNQVLHRLGAVTGAENLGGELKAAVAKTGRAELIQLRNTRGRRWVAEIVSGPEHGLVQVWELMPSGTSMLRFSWQGPLEELQNAFN